MLGEADRKIRNDPFQLKVGPLLRGFECPDRSELAWRPLSVRESLWGEREGELGEYLPEKFFVITMGFHFYVKVNENFDNDGISLRCEGKLE